MATGFRSWLSVRKKIPLCSLNVLPLSVIESPFLLLFITRGWISIGFTLLNTLITLYTLPRHSLFISSPADNGNWAFTSFSCRNFSVLLIVSVICVCTPQFLLWFLQWDVQKEFQARDDLYISVLLISPIPQVTFVLLQGAKVFTEQWTRALLCILQRSHNYYRNMAEEPKLVPHLQITT